MVKRSFKKEFQQLFRYKTKRVWTRAVDLIMEKKGQKSFNIFWGGCAPWLVGFEFPNMGWNLGPWHWEHRVLTTGMLGNSFSFFSILLCVNCWIIFNQTFLQGRDHLFSLEIFTEYILYARHSFGQWKSNGERVKIPISQDSFCWKYQKMMLPLEVGRLGSSW